MNNVRITRIFSFEAAHALSDYEGPCRHIHGHSYKLWVTVFGRIDPATSMLIDFGLLKNIINEAIIKVFDHKLLLYKNDPMVGKNIGNITENLVLLPVNPSSENMVISFSKMIAGQLPENVSLHHLKLYETELSFTEWYADDNK